MDDATLLVAEAIGEIMGFWNFKPSMGRVWSILYLAQQPLTAEEIAERSQLSSGMVSMSLTELQHWGVVQRVIVPGSRKRHYAPETDILALVTRVFRERELRVIDQALDRLQQAARIIDAQGKSSRPDEMMRSRFLATRVANLVKLARVGREVVARFAKAGSLDLGRIRGALRREG